MTTNSSTTVPAPQPKTRTIWAWTIATFFGAGLGKPGPGTYGSVAAMLLWLLAGTALHIDAQALLILLLVGILFSIALGVPAASIAARESGRKDPGFVVIDEVAGQWITLLSSPADWRHGLIALILFRLFDITKPWPVSWMDRNWKSALGTMLDDVGAALMASGVFWLLLRFVPSLLS
ncbi:MAG: phosphatidylglycerophosphatase A family protein [Bdellovibrionota bacterium]